jgi:hypothetical protein
MDFLQEKHFFRNNYQRHFVANVSLHLEIYYFILEYTVYDNVQPHFD